MTEGAVNTEKLIEDLRYIRQVLTDLQPQVRGVLPAQDVRFAIARADKAISTLGEAPCQK